MRKKIVFLLPSLGGGGSERVFLNLCKQIDKTKYNVILCLLNRSGEFVSFLEERNDFTVHDLGISRVRKSIIPIIKFIRKNNPDILISTLGHLNALLGPISFLFPRNVRLVGRESNMISLVRHNSLTLILYKLFYKNFDKIVVQSLDMEADLKKMVRNLKSGQVIKINNPVDVNFIRRSNQCDEELVPKGKINLITVGSLTYQKGYDLLLSSFANFVNMDTYHLTILGEGQLYDELVFLIKNLGVEDYVSLLGFKGNPFKYIAQSSIFISSSRYEGFPNAVLEALACDIPVIANNYKGGINEIIDIPIFGEIIDISNSLAFESACEKLARREIPNGSISSKIESKYGLVKITSEYENLFSSLLKTEQ